jgi:hypothetical protein
MISIELLSKVFGFKVVDVKNPIGNLIIVYFDNDSDISYNIYELAHKCKKWAWDNGYEIVSLKNRVEVWDKSAENCLHTITNLTQSDEVFDIFYDFKACQWILDNKDKQ